MAKLKQSIIEALKQAITESGMTYLQLERETGVARASIMRFMRDERTLRLDMADRLATYLGLTVNRPKRKAR